MNQYKHKGKQTGSIICRFNPGKPVDYIFTVMYYDKYRRLIQSKSSNHLNGTDTDYIAYNFIGQPIKKTHIHEAMGKNTQTELYTYTYDHASRLKETTHQLNGKSKIVLDQKVYDELGRLKLSTRNGNEKLKTSYNYNIRSWIKNIVNPLFSETVYYQDHPNKELRRYKGDISGMKWTVQGEVERGYDFKYDNLSRLMSADYTGAGKYSTSYAYDKHGNMTKLTREGKLANGTYGSIDNVTLVYMGNQLTKATDTAGNIALSESADFKTYSNQPVEYLYNKNGALIKDFNKGVSNIQYNSLNLPKLLDVKSPVAEARNEYTYTASGVKLKVVQKWNPNYSTNPVIGSAVTSSLLTQTKTIDYVGNVIYENGVLKRILIDGGYIEDGIYYFYLTDHLGSNRVIAKADGTITQINHYYPFGMAFADKFDNGTKQPYKYTDKELDATHGLNWYDSSARWMDGIRFTTMDPLAEKYFSWSPYAYCANNPLRFIDPDGMDWALRVVDGTWEIYYDRDITSQNQINRIYGKDSGITHIATGTTATFKDNDGNILGQYTFTNDSKENKYGTVTDANGNQLDNSSITYGEGYTIFGTSDDSLNAGTLYQNLFGSHYIGPNNPKKYNKKDDSYDMKPQGLADAAAMQHDLDYDAKKAKGLSGAFRDTSVLDADITLVNASRAIMNNPNALEWDKKRAKSISNFFTPIAIIKGASISKAVKFKNK